MVVALECSARHERKIERVSVYHTHTHIYIYVGLHGLQFDFWLPFLSTIQLQVSQELADDFRMCRHMTSFRSLKQDLWEVSVQQSLGICQYSVGECQQADVSVFDAPTLQLLCVPKMVTSTIPAVLTRVIWHWAYMSIHGFHVWQLPCFTWTVTSELVCSGACKKGRMGSSERCRRCRTVQDSSAPRQNQSKRSKKDPQRCTRIGITGQILSDCVPFASCC